MQPSARKFGNAVRKCLKENSFEATVKTKTTSFSGFGYGDGISADVTTSKPIPEEIKEKLSIVLTGFENQADEGNHFIISLHGSPYPFGGSIGK